MAIDEILKQIDLHGIPENSIINLPLEKVTKMHKNQNSMGSTLRNKSPTTLVDPMNSPLLVNITEPSNGAYNSYNVLANSYEGVTARFSKVKSDDSPIKVPIDRNFGPEHGLQTIQPLTMRNSPSQKSESDSDSKPGRSPILKLERFRTFDNNTQKSTPTHDRRVISLSKSKNNYPAQDVSMNQNSPKAVYKSFVSANEEESSAQPVGAKVQSSRRTERAGETSVTDSVKNFLKTVNSNSNNELPDLMETDEDKSLESTPRKKPDSKEVTKDNH